MMQSDHAKVIYGVISSPKRKMEMSLQAGETQKEGNKGKCHEQDL